MTGYLHPQYIHSLSDYGVPRELPHCGGWILERGIPGTEYLDAMGPYPLFCCKDWTRLHLDLAVIQEEKKLASIALVTDPFAGCDEAYLHTCFPDRMFAYKDHYLVHLPCDMNKAISKHHRYYARRTMKSVDVEVVESPAGYEQEWTSLYNVLCDRHKLTGIHRFSATAFKIQFGIPGAVYFRAINNGECIGGHIWYVQNGVAYSHLAAFTEQGYDLMASYAIYWKAIEYFSDKVDWMDIGAGAGLAGDAGDGLTRFKRGWATDSRPVYFCGRIFNHLVYDDLMKSSGAQRETFFPAYRASGSFDAENNTP